MKILSRIIALPLGLSLSSLALHAQPTEEYDYGDPTPYEQYMLELVNTARANPGAEIERVKQVYLARYEQDPETTTQLVINTYGNVLNVLTFLQEFNINSGLTGEHTLEDKELEPLAHNVYLEASARAHSTWMLDNDVFSHTGVDNTQSSDRIFAAGYPLDLENTPSQWSWSSGENLGWLGSTQAIELTSTTASIHDGLIFSPVHRVNVMAEGFKELGIGMEEGMFLQGENDFNAFMATQNYGFSEVSPNSEDGGSFLTGVIYDDKDNDGAYTPGEGISGVTVMPAEGKYYTVTGTAGGYSIPVGAFSGELSVTIEGGALAQSQTSSVTFDGEHNAKLDFVGEALRIGGALDVIKEDGDWKESSWFGWFQGEAAGNSEWLSHINHGYIYYFPAAETDAYLWDFELGWLWTSEQYYPIMFRFTGNHWLFYYEGGTKPERWFFDYKAGTDRREDDFTSEE